MSVSLLIGNSVLSAEVHLIVSNIEVRNKYFKTKEKLLKKF